MLPKDIHSDNLDRHSSEDAAGDAGNTAVAHVVIGRYTGGPVPGRTVSFMHRRAHPKLSGEKCLSLAHDLTRRWKWGSGSTILSGGPLPLLRSVFRTGTENGISERGSSATKSMSQPKARIVIPTQPGGLSDRPRLQRKTALTGGGDPSALPLPDEEDANEQPVQEVISDAAAGRQPGPKREQTALSSSVELHSRARSGTRLERKHVAGKSPGQEVFAAGTASPIAEPAVEANMGDMSIRIMERYNSPPLARKYRRANDGFDFLRGKSEMSRNITASYRQAPHDTASVRLKTAVNRRSMNSALQGGSHTPQENRVSRKVAGMTGTAGNIRDLQADKVQRAGNKGDKVVKMEILPPIESSGPRKLLTDSTLTRKTGELSPYSGLRHVPTKKGKDAATLPPLPVTGSQLSGKSSGESAGRNLLGTVAFTRAAGPSPGLTLLRGAVLKTADAAAEPSGTGTSPGGSEPSGTSGLQSAKATHVNPSHADRKDAGIAASLETSDGFIPIAAKSAEEHVTRKVTGELSTFSTARGETAYGTDLFRPLTLRGNTGIMRKIFRLRSESPFSRDIARVQLIQNGRLIELRASVGKRQGTMYSGADSTVHGSGPPGHAGLPFFARRPMEESADAVAGLSSGKPFGSRETMPLPNRKSNFGSDGGKTGNGSALAGGAERRESSGYLHISVTPDGGTGAASGPAASATLATNSFQAAEAGDANSATLDLERIADEVYRIIERRLIVEKERKGL